MIDFADPFGQCLDRFLTGVTLHVDGGEPLT
jgi:hypothetical protein